MKYVGELFADVALRAKPKPFVKWAGGKRQIVDKLIDRVPKAFNKYIEPFLGGGALLFALLPKKAVVGDINEELINAYRVIRDNVEDLIHLLKDHERKHSREHYYKIRSLDRNKLTDTQRAARFIYLNRTCYNGLYRENSRGEFNVPIGNYKNPTVCDEENLKAISEYLNTAEITILCGDYKDTLEFARPGDFIYLDPPYVPSSETANFTKYTRYDFRIKDQEELASIFKELDNLGCFVMLTNSDTELVRKLYKGFKIEVVETNRFINSVAHRRKHHRDLIVRNYE